MLQSTFRQLEVFAIVVGEGSFAAGAERLGISQPAVSNHIRALERQVGFSLLERRRGTRAGLTEQGRQLYEQTAAILHQAEQISLGLPRSRSREKKREITIIGQPYVIGRWVRPFLTEFMQSHSTIVPIIRTGYYEEMVRTIEAGDADIAYFASDGPSIDIESKRICEEPGGLYVSTSHPLAGRTDLSAAEICRHAFIMPVRTSQLGMAVVRMLASAGIVGFPVAFQAHSIDVTRDMLLEGAGISCLFDAYAEPDVKNGKLVKLEIKVPSMKVYQILSRQARPGGPVDAFVNHIASRIHSRIAA